MHTLKISIMALDIQINHWGLHSWGHRTLFKNNFFLQSPCPSLILHSSSPCTAEIPAGNLPLSSHFAHRVYDSSSSARTEQCWALLRINQNRTNSVHEEGLLMPHNLQTAEIQGWGSSCRSATTRLPPALKEFSRAWGEAPLHCAARAPAPSPPSQASHTAFKSLPALGFLASPCKSHTTHSLSPH